MHKMHFAVLLLFSLVLFLNVGGVAATNPTNSTTFTLDQVTNASTTVKSCVESNHNIPSSVSISGSQVSMPQFLKLSTEAVININNGSNTTMTLNNFGAAPVPSETATNGIINSAEYLDIANRVSSFMNSNGKAPNYARSSLGNIRYESLIYMYSQILNSYNQNNVLPEFIRVNKWSVVSNSGTVFYSVDQVNDAAGRVKAYVEVNHRLPNYVTMQGKQVSMPSFLQLSTTTLLNVAGNFGASTALGSYGSAPNPAETIKSKNMGQLEYLKIASNVQTFMDVFGKAPNYATSSLGNIRYESLVYTYSQILNYYSLNKYLPENVTVDPWTLVSNSGTVFYSVDQVNDAASRVKAYVEVNHRLPNYVTMQGKQVKMPSFLQLLNTELLNINGDLCAPLISRDFGAAPVPSETAKGGVINSTEYFDIANRFNAFTASNGKVPNYSRSSIGNIRFESLVYMYAQIVSSYNKNNRTLPDCIKVNPWTVVSSTSTVFINMDQVYDASRTVESYVKTNHKLPDYVTISGKQINMNSFLQLSTTALLNIENNLDTSIVLENVGNALNSIEDITSGDIQQEEYTEIAEYVKKSIESHGVAPSYAYQTGLGTHMGFASLVYMYSQILNSYSASKTLMDYITITPWVAVSNPNAIYNYQTNKVFNSIQAAVDDSNTLSGETIGLGIGTISENVVVNKELTLMSVPTMNVTVHAANPDLPVFTITMDGSGSIIQDLVIEGSTGNAGIYINNSFYNTISDNIISCSSKGVYIDNATDNQISDNEILNNTLNGIFIDMGSDNNIVVGNTLTDNDHGISINSANGNTIFNNLILNNVEGINLKNSSADINFNRIIANDKYGLYNIGNGTVNAINNWWGSNNPEISSINPICSGDGGDVTYDPWLVLSVISSCDRSNTNGTCYSYTITADLNHNNHGKDINADDPFKGKSHDNNLPDRIPVNFNTNLGTIDTTASTRNGKSVATLNSAAAGLANVSATLDYQTVTIPVNVTSVNMPGIYNARTNKGFSTIQSAVDDVNTLDGDTITLANGTYTENVVVYKKLTIKPVSGANVTVRAVDPCNGVFTVIEGGSTIQNLNIVGSTDSYGILGYANDLNLTGNTVSFNNYGIILYNSTGSTVSGNTVMDNWYGNIISNSPGNTVSGNNVKSNWYGIYTCQANNTEISGNTVEDNWYGIFINLSTIILSKNSITGNNAGIFISNSNSTLTGNTVTNNGVGISCYQSNSTISPENSITDNWIANSSVVDDNGLVIQSNIWNCGPASLATVMNNMGFNVTDTEIADLAGTDKSGTTMYGLVHAAQVKGLNATGMILPVNQLKPNYIVLLTVDGLYHFSVIKDINDTMVLLADSAFGNINMTLESFTAQYSGYVLVTTNSTNTANGTLLTNEQMKTIVGTNGYGIVGSLFEFGGEALGAVVRGVCLPVGIICTIASLTTVGGRDEMSYINKYNREHQPTPKYSPSHGYRPTKKIPKYTKPTTHYNRYPSKSKGGYVSPTKGYVRTRAVNPVDQEYQHLYDQYLNRKADQLKKINGVIGYDSLSVNRNLEKVQNGLFSASPPDGDKATFIINLYKWSKKKISTGINEIKVGNYAKGAADITVGTGGLQLWGSYFTYILWPEGLWPKVK
jgi:parallel beta-helix repeat protein